MHILNLSDVFVLYMPNKRFLGSFNEEKILFTQKQKVRCLVVTSGANELHVDEMIQLKFTSLDLTKHITHNKCIVLTEVLNSTLNTVESPWHSDSTFILLLFEDSQCVLYSF